MNDLIAKIKPVLKKYHIQKASLFGSYARGEEKGKSDVDILIKLHKKSGLFDFIGVKQDLEDALDKKVDVVEYRGIKPALKKNILSSQIPIYP